MFAFLVLADMNDRRNGMRIQRRTLRDQTDPFTMPEERFIELFCLTKEVARNLIEEMSPHMVQGHRKTFIPIPIRICAALNFFASGSLQRDIGDGFGAAMSRTMVSRIVNEVATVLQDHLLGKWIRFPTMDKYDDIKKRFFEETGFPGVIGAIDCTHIRIRKPSKDIEFCYFNRSKFHSKNVQLICDYDLEILGVYARFGGGTNDSYIWQVSNIKALLENRYKEDSTNHNSHLLGDASYPLQPWLMTPYRTAASSKEEKRFNTYHARARSCVERLSGVLKSVFKCLQLELCYSPQTAGKIINACCVLHNFRKSHGLVKVDGNVLEDDDTDVFEGDNDNVIEVDDDEGTSVKFKPSKVPFRDEARTIRDRLKMQLRNVRKRKRTPSND